MTGSKKAARGGLWTSALNRFSGRLALAARAHEAEHGSQQAQAPAAHRGNGLNGQADGEVAARRAGAGGAGGVVGQIGFARYVRHAGLKRQRAGNGGRGGEADGSFYPETLRKSVSSGI